MQASFLRLLALLSEANPLSLLTLTRRLLRRLRVLEAQAAKAAQHDDSACVGDAHRRRNRRSRLLDGLVGLVDAWLTRFRSRTDLVLALTHA